MGGELSKHEGVLFHFWPLSSKRNDKLQSFFPDMNLIQTSKTTINLLDVGLKWYLSKFQCHFEGVRLAVRGCTCMFRGCSRTLKTPNSPPPGISMGADCWQRIFLNISRYPYFQTPWNPLNFSRFDTLNSKFALGYQCALKLILQS